MATARLSNSKYLPKAASSSYTNTVFDHISTTASVWSTYMQYVLQLTMWLLLHCYVKVHDHIGCFDSQSCNRTGDTIHIAHEYKTIVFGVSRYKIQFYHLEEAQNPGAEERHYWFNETQAKLSLVITFSRPGSGIITSNARVFGSTRPMQTDVIWEVEASRPC
ncbi:hypothetical protein J1614_012079 [Plenodomus biglobosus]|nr:hypothetical protein J1614_012079 [Plenodomus biglobosus]